MQDISNQNPVIVFLADQGYKDFRIVQGKLCATLEYMTIRGICVGLTMDSLEHRYCYQNRQEASTALLAWKDEEFAPGNLIKLKGTKDGKHVDLLNPNCR